MLPTDHRRSGRRRNKSAGSRSPLALKALTAKHWPPLRRLERNGRLDATLRTFGARLGARKPSRSWPRAGLQSSASPLGLARLTAFRVVLELLVEKKELFPSGEDEFTTTIS